MATLTRQRITTTNLNTLVGPPWDGMRTAAVLLLFVVPILAGCLGNGAPEETIAPPTPEPEFGEIVGVAVDDEVRPVANATVFLVEESRNATTGADGTFRFDQVATGTKMVRAVAEGHGTAEARVEVAADAVAEAQLTLPVLPEYVARNLTSFFEGHYDCANEIPIWTGDCLILYENVTGQPDPYTTETFTFYMPIDPRWDSIVLELTYETSANNQLDGMRVYLEHVTDEQTGHSVKVGRADGNENPLRLVVNRGEPHPQADVDPATGEPATFDYGGDLAQIRVFPKGHLWEYTSQVCNSEGRCFLGVGAGLDIKFTVYATVFYNERAPDGFTAVPA